MYSCLASSVIKSLISSLSLGCKSCEIPNSNSLEFVNSLSTGTCPLIHPNYFSVIIFVSVTELTLTLTLNRPKNNSGELTDKHLSKILKILHYVLLLVIFEGHQQWSCFVLGPATQSVHLFKNAEYLFSRLFVPWNIRSRERINTADLFLLGPFVPWTVHSLEISFQVP